MEAVEIDEPIRVGAAFDRGRALPLWFLWKDRYYTIRCVNFIWISDSGSARLHHFSAYDGSNSYELCFNAASLEWTLKKICLG